MYNTRMESDALSMLTSRFSAIAFGWALRLGSYRIRTDTEAFSTLCKAEETPRYTSLTYDNLRYCTSGGWRDEHPHYVAVRDSFYKQRFIPWEDAE